MRADFDAAAANYDSTFTNSVIGKLQRKYVYRHLSKIIEGKNLNILEINCGTGEDAIWLAEKGHLVTATDVSENMIAVAKSKNAGKDIRFIVADINKISGFENEKFDLVFSNFGGLNCLSKPEFADFFINIATILSEKGKLVLVIMPKNTLWEQFYFLMKGNFKTISRRKKTSAIANVDGENVLTYYHNPKEAVTLAAAYFDVKGIYPIGFFIPPSYLEPFLSKRQLFSGILDRLENAVTNVKSLSKYADHYCIVFEKR
ncbi:class I SAM-dependent DNA methyltransferase [Flavobacterium sp. 3HN19-14]|uniref:class I SAM-dependent DNA methyltransferase n=1 Tax=Flavobacterium sp. 3HN19-14 TaxID=3448133 RepID=UPI003EE1C5E0